MRILLSFSVLSCFLLVACSASNGKTVTIAIDAVNFVPDPVSVERGTNVCWKNDDTVPHWPASNIHPTHEIYPEFDPKRDLVPGETWCFVFTKTGIWKYHDHSFADRIGTVNVE